MLALGATPFPGAPETPDALPAAMPATCEPWAQRLSVPSRQLAVSASADPEPVCDVPPPGQSPTSFESRLPPAVKQASEASRLPKNGWSRSIPVSRIATASPVPV